MRASADIVRLRSDSSDEDACDVVALIQAPAVITRILRHRQLPDARPTMRPSRDPPLARGDMDDDAVFAE